MKEIEAVAGMTLGAGTLYGVIARLEDEHLIEALPSEERRHRYRITASGAAALRDQLEITSRVADIGLGRLRGATS